MPKRTYLNGYRRNAMSKAHICDRCGAVYSTSETGVTVGVMDECVPNTVLTWPTGEKDWATKRELCSDCSGALALFFKGWTVEPDE